MKPTRRPKCTDKAPGCTCVSCRVVRARARGTYNPRPKYNIWLPEHENWLRENAGKMLPEELAAAIYDRFGISRTPKAVKVRIQRLGLSLLTHHYSALEVANIFDVSNTTVYHWIQCGFLSARKVTPGILRSHWLLTEEDVEQFIRSHVVLFEYKRIRRQKWRALAEVIWRRDPYHSTATAARILGIPRLHVWQYIKNGVLKAERLPPRGQGNSSDGGIRPWVVRGSELARFYREVLRNKNIPLQTPPGTSTAHLVTTECSSTVIQLDRRRSLSVLAARS